MCVLVGGLEICQQLWWSVTALLLCCWLVSALLGGRTEEFLFCGPYHGRGVLIWQGETLRSATDLCDCDDIAVQLLL